MIVSLCIGVIQLMVLPILIGTVTERIASRNWLISGSIWNLSIKLCMSWFLLEYVVQLTKDFNTDTTTTTSSSSSSSSSSSMMWTWLYLFYKLILVCLSTQLGCAFQPVGITGSIATGKSTVCQMLLRNKNDTTNFIIIDLDTIGHDILIPGKLKNNDSAYHQLVQVFGTDILSQDKKKKNNNDDDSSNKSIQYPPIDRRKLGDIIFRNDQKRRMLNRMTHPLISKIMMKRILYYGYQQIFAITKKAKSVVCVDCPLLFEIGLKMKVLFGIKVVIACHPEIQLKRLMQRNPDLTQEQCQSRIDSQIPIMKKIQMADVIIWNNGTLQDLAKEVIKAQKEISSKTIGYGLSFTQTIFLSGLFYIVMTIHMSN